ncbi:MAG: hypothetical protein RQ930_01965 [Candidatus Aenigmarchaeota archaeon]|nr:hypothetical protein [Candidatus Aenigmarchaeota archaeon]
MSDDRLYEELEKIKKITGLFIKDFFSRAMTKERLMKIVSQIKECEQRLIRNYDEEKMKVYNIGKTIGRIEAFLALEKVKIEVLDELEKKKAKENKK